MNLIDTFKDKLENLVVPEASADPGLWEVESGHDEELAEEDETLISDELRRPGMPKKNLQLIVMK